MTRIRFILLLSLISICIVLMSCGGNAKENEDASPVAVPKVFAGPEHDIMKELFTIWQHPGQIGSLQQAAQRVGVDLTDSLRRDMLTKMEANLNMHSLIARYRPYTFVLTNAEKRLASYIRNYEQKNAEFPALDSVAAHVNMPPQEVKDRLQFLSSIGMFYDLGGPDKYNKLGFSYGNKLANFLFDLGIHIHTIRVGQSPPLNVGCGEEAMYVVASEYPDSEVTYTTYDPISLAPITIEFKQDEIASTSPDSLIFLKGGTCGTNNFFTSRADAQAFGAHLPQWQGQMLPIYTLQQGFDYVKTQLKNKK